ncbi:4-hydroxy-3-methylbut-2-en-1-yl diphosphate synthase [Bifidobacterium bifidum]|nr:4-hydroxy-3-methylbut-2-en-1-yl diphosphate synthase [Bifidobacterium bifidum]
MMNTLNTEKSAEKPFRKTGNPVELTSESPLHPRRKSHRIMVGSVPVGGGAPISVQSMTNTLTANVPATLQQIAELTAAGCDIVRVAVPSQDDADALPEICRKSPVPIIADIHFQSKYVFQAIDAGCAAVRVNPGNIRKFNEVGPSICKAATDAGISLRIGVNAGSLDKELYAKYGGPTPEALVASALKEAHMFEDVGFHDFKISVKHHDHIGSAHRPSRYDPPSANSDDASDCDGSRWPGRMPSRAATPHWPARCPHTAVAAHRSAMRDPRPLHRGKDRDDA